MSVTIYDIAAEAEVSIATVSRVFNDSPRVSEATRARVQIVAHRMGYHPHAMAQGLARRATGLVSAVIPVLTNYFYMEVLRGIQDALSTRGLDLIVYTAPTPEEVEEQLRRALQRGRAEGLLVLSTPIDDERALQLQKSRQPVALVDSAHPAFDSFVVDNESGAYLATRHLIERGMRHIVHLTVFPEPPPAVERRRGYERAMKEAGLPVHLAASERRPYGFTEEAGHDVTRRLIEDGGPLPDALFAASDVQALGALLALQEAGIDVPGQIAIVGFDDIKVAAYARLTTVRQPMHAMGEQAALRLLDRLDDPTLAPDVRCFAPQLIVRATSPST